MILLSPIIGKSSRYIYGKEDHKETQPESPYYRKKRGETGERRSIFCCPEIERNKKRLLEKSEKYGTISKLHKDYLGLEASDEDN